MPNPLPLSKPKDNPALSTVNESAPTKSPDLFADLTTLRIAQDFSETYGVKKALLTVPIRKPGKEWFVRTHPELRIETCVIELKEERETYLVAPALRSELASESTFGPRHPAAVAR
jgi:hypothetical protein